MSKCEYSPFQGYAAFVLACKARITAKGVVQLLLHIPRDCQIGHVIIFPPRHQQMWGWGITGSLLFLRNVVFPNRCEHNQCPEPYVCCRTSPTSLHRFGLSVDYLYSVLLYKYTHACSTRLLWWAPIIIGLRDWHVYKQCQKIFSSTRRSIIWYWQWLVVLCSKLRCRLAPLKLGGCASGRKRLCDYKSKNVFFKTLWFISRLAWQGSRFTICCKVNAGDDTTPLPDYLLITTLVPFLPVCCLWWRTDVYMSLSRHQPTDESNTDEENDETIDPELRLRTVRTAASAIAESIRTDQRAERRRSTIHKRSRFFRSKPADKKHDSPTATVAPAASRIPGARRNIYVNHSLSAMEVDHSGEPRVEYVRNKVRTTSKSFYYFFLRP